MEKNYYFHFRQKAVGDNYQTVLDELVHSSTASCPKFEISDCQLQALRYETGGDNAMCPGDCPSIGSTFEEYFPLKCKNDDYTSEIWANTDKAGMNAEDRMCCEFRIGPTSLIAIVSISSLSKMILIAFLKLAANNLLSVKCTTV